MSSIRRLAKSISSEADNRVADMVTGTVEIPLINSKAQCIGLDQLPIVLS